MENLVDLPGHHCLVGTPWLLPGEQMDVIAELAWVAMSVLAQMIVSEPVLAENPGFELMAVLSPGFAVLALDDHSGAGIAWSDLHGDQRVVDEFAAQPVGMADRADEHLQLGLAMRSMLGKSGRLGDP